MMKKPKDQQEPLALLMSKYIFSINEIETLSTGLKYTAVLLKNGNIGVCANLGESPSSDKNNYRNPKLDNLSHRIVINAYFNALLNYSKPFEGEADIFKAIDFTLYNKVVMFGFIQPVVKIFQALKIPIQIFDFQKEDPILKPLIEQKTELKNADALILTSTSVFNGSFLDAINSTKINCDIFMIGPSSIMSRELFGYRNIKIIFGARFEKFDQRVLNIIKENGGTRKFLKLQDKGLIQKENVL